MLFAQIVSHCLLTCKITCATSFLFVLRKFISDVEANSVKFVCGSFHLEILIFLILQPCIVLVEE